MSPFESFGVGAAVGLIKLCLKITLSWKKPLPMWNSHQFHISLLFTLLLMLYLRQAYKLVMKTQLKSKKTEKLKEKLMDLTKFTKR